MKTKVSNLKHQIFLAKNKNQDKSTFEILYPVWAHVTPYDCRNNMPMFLSKNIHNQIKNLHKVVIKIKSINEADVSKIDAIIWENKMFYLIYKLSIEQEFLTLIVSNVNIVNLNVNEIIKEYEEKEIK
ncbi:hypothetical protein [Candidatus Gromoviella agglomerans]|uniref:hypothetical protein n=1 Tax=Candidatus Gromoviella agglomerans TaxID=2806609 RepID=UPI001E37354A|nr:hypothetical protein [Candidatus Gromoviella agglomerans]UFX98264.1 hypothetical protein Gromo_00147 [Candidatus Gromoviella agglomerans]